jgi:ABC-type multidrug transport system fused ATPase/permease subunit
MISVERCESALNIKIEKNPNKNEEIIIKDKFFPKEGKIEFINFSAKYRPFTPVILKNINLKINPCERVGIIGRTGSGKTSLINSIFRIIEGFEGKILIDDIDINKLNLDFLRQNLTIVTQEPFLLEGSLRENIDPLNLHSEKEIIEILDSFCLFNEIQNNYRRLKIEIKENGNNLSIGEKQLICFARAALKKSKIIILDEATSSLDYNTEKIINENMEKMFKDCTIILITHRFNVVKICEKIFVVDNGEIIEKGVYGNLIKDKKSKFSELYSEIII